MMYVVHRCMCTRTQLLINNLAVGSELHFFPKLYRFHAKKESKVGCNTSVKGEVRKVLKGHAANSPLINR